MSFRIFVDRLAQEASETDVTTLFTKAGFELEHVKIPTLPGQEGKHRGYAFVTLKSEQEGLRAIKYLNNAKIYGKHVQLEPAHASAKNENKERDQGTRHDDRGGSSSDQRGALVPAEGPPVPQGMVQVRFANGDNVLVPYNGRILDLKIKVAPMVDMFYPQISITSDDGKQCMDDNYHVPRTRRVMCVLHEPAGDDGAVEFKRMDWIAIIKQYAYAFDDFTVWKGCQMACDPRHVEDAMGNEVYFKWTPRELLVDLIMDEIRSAEGTPDVVDCLLLAGRRGSDGESQCSECEDNIVDSKDRFGATALMKSVLYRRRDIARLLAQKWHADVHVMDDYHNTPIMKATEMNDTEMIQLLIHCGADQMIPMRPYDGVPNDDEHAANIDAVAEMLEHVKSEVRFESQLHEQHHARKERKHKRGTKREERTKEERQQRHEYVDALAYQADIAQKRRR
eukprot:GEMP01015070.1.p1 GENE.GEMP01015070.1~~GEMP01015070.1.p1  ORF type:complete len:451 (+),score=89.67 GEMP01015070.1:89-1441(+)